MSARVMNPAMMTEMTTKLSAIVSSSQVINNNSSSNNNNSSQMSGQVGRVVPSRAALARVRRDLFGPVDHAAAKAYAERELRAQSLADSERWGFDFRLELPKSNSRFEWQPLTSEDLVPEPYALRGMPYLRRQSPPTPLKLQLKSHRSPRSCETSPISAASSASILLESVSPPPPTTTTTTATTTAKSQLAERTPPQEGRVPVIGEKTPDVVPAIAELTVRSTPARPPGSPMDQQPITPVLSARKQAAITDYMKSRKRALSGTTKSMVEPAEKVSRNAGQIRS